MHPGIHSRVQTALLTSTVTLSLAVATAEETRGVNLGRIFETIAEAEYEIHWQPEVAAWQAPNRACGLRFTFEADAVTVEPRSPVGVTDSWWFSLSHASTGDEEMVLAPNTFRLDVAQQRATYQHSGMSIEYLNEPSGLHQSFLVHEPPAGGILALTIRVQLDGVWMGPADGLDGVVFLSAITGRKVADYSGLFVVDAAGRQLPARMGMSRTSGIVIEVDDAGANYPIIVDPWIRPHEAPLVSDPNQLGAHFGYSIAYFERFLEGSYYGSLIVGAPWFDDGATDQGKVFAFLSDGDVNGDLLIDLLVGAPRYQGGRVSLFNGSAAGLGATPTAHVYGSGSERFGSSLAFAGDVNGLNQKDVLVGAPDHNSGAGRVLLFDGTSTGLQTTAYWTYNGAQTGARLGHSVWGDVDTNNDGRLDIIVGAPYHDNVTVNEGRVFVFAGSTYGGSPPSLFATLESPGHQAGARFGWAVSGGHLGDLSAAADIIVGAPYYDVNPGDDRGKVFVFWGGNSINLNPDYLDSGLTGTTGEHFGSSLCFIPKILPPPGDLSCLAAGAPEAKVQNLIRAGAVVLWQFVP